MMAIASEAESTFEIIEEFREQRERARGMFYAEEYAKGYHFLLNALSGRVHAKAKALRKAGYDAIVHDVALDVTGNPIGKSAKAILLRPINNQTLESALRFAQFGRKINKPSYYSSTRYDESFFK